MGTSPCFSIIVPSYNRAALLSGTIQSVLAQEFTDFELIIVNDGGVDNTADVVSRFQDQRVKYFEKVNEERGAARNYGVKKAVGQYMTFLDSDDLLKPNHLAVAFDFLKRMPEANVFNIGYDVITPSGEVIYPWKPLPSPVNIKLVEGNFLSCIGVFVKRSILMENPFNEDRRLSGSEDYELWLRLGARYQIFSIPVSTAAIVNHDDRSVLNFSPDNLIDRREQLKFYIWKDPEVVKTYKQYQKKIEGYMDLYVSLHLVMGSHKGLGFSKLLNAFFQYPLMVLNYRFWVVIKKIIFN